MDFVAVVLAGGRSGRLGGVAKQGLLLDGRSLLARTLDAVSDAREIVVVGDESYVPAAVRARVTVTREKPAFGGPAAAVAAGLDALPAPPTSALTPAAASAGPAALDLRATPGLPPAPEFALVLACDMPRVAVAVQALLAAAAVLDPAADGVMAVDADGRPQYLTAAYRLDALRGAVAAARARASVQNLSARALFAPLNVVPVEMPPGATSDVDTPDDALAFGIVVNPPAEPAPAVSGSKA